jgi:multidrug efflux pump
MSLLLIAFGVLSFLQLPLREFPDIDPPVVSIRTNYPGAAAAVVETRITEVIEQRIAGVEGIDFITSTSEDGRSSIDVTFRTGRDVDAAANDIRDRVSPVLDDLPTEADPPEIQKVDSNDDIIVWLNLVSPNLTVPELTDYARRYLVDRFSVLDGVARVHLHRPWGGIRCLSRRRTRPPAHPGQLGECIRALLPQRRTHPAFQPRNARRIRRFEHSATV